MIYCQTYLLLVGGVRGDRAPQIVMDARKISSAGNLCVREGSGKLGGLAEPVQSKARAKTYIPGHGGKTAAGGLSNLDIETLPSRL
jgi:hypothetical protein